MAFFFKKRTRSQSGLCDHVVRVTRFERTAASGAYAASGRFAAMIILQEAASSPLATEKTQSALTNTLRFRGPSD